MDEIVDRISDLVEQEVENLGGDLGKIEQIVLQTVMSLGCGVLQRLVDRADRGYRGSSIYCKGCGGSMRFVEYRSKTLHSLFGWITAKRGYYHCRPCGAGTVPYDVQRGLGDEQITPGLAKFCCTLAVDDSFDESSRKVEALLGEKVSERTIERVVHHVGGVVLDRQNDRLQNYFQTHDPPDSQVQPRRLYIATDGTTVHEVDGWHEAKIGSIYWENERFERQRRYVGGFDNSERFGWHLWLEGCLCGLRGSDEVVYLGDAAGWIRTEHDRHFRRATFIIDWYHASEHVWDCGKVLFGEGTAKTKRWVEKRLAWLWEGRIKRLLGDLDRQRGRSDPAGVEAVEALDRYLSTNAEQMRYDLFRAKGYDIGSGAVEGACKHVVGKRLKQSGMKWSRAGSSATLALRISWLNNEWDQLWSTKPLSA